MRDEILIYLSERAEGVLPVYIAARIRGEDAPPPVESRHYAVLREEQRADGGYGRFHTMDSKDFRNHVFPTTEAAVYRMRDLMLEPDDPVVAGAGRALLGYVDGSLAYSDTIEHHFGFTIFLSTLAAANAAILGIRDPLIEARKRLCARAVEEAALEIQETNTIDLAEWEKRSRARCDFMLRPEMVHMLWLLAGNKSVDRHAAKVYLNYLWNLEKGVYYASSFPAARFMDVSSGGFGRWMFLLEQFAGTEAFPDLMKGGAYDFLEREALLLIRGETVLRASAGILGRYWESRRNSSALAWEVVARAARLMRRAEM